ncbi:MAG: ISAzo13 family transposase, partial [Actinomycetia bacterium]|nr:ISAzo13 family transposase [Actinomycetes bacterium]
MEVSGDELGEFFGVVLPHLNEVQRRVVAGAMATAIGYGGKTAVAEASGLGRNTVAKGVGEVAEGIEPSDRLRAPGAGDKAAVDKQPGLLEALDELVWPETRGHPESPLRWTLTSTYGLARQLTSRGFKVSAELVRRLLHQMGYSLQAPAKQVEGTSHPDRDAQFDYLNKVVAERLGQGEPVISVDTKNKELIGRHGNGGTDWRPRGD